MELLKKAKKIWLFLLMIGLLTSLIVGWQRHQVEQANKTVEMVLDYSDLVALAQSQGYDLDRVLQKFKEAGVTSLAVGEKTLEDWEKSGEVGILNDSEVTSIRLLTGRGQLPAGEKRGGETYLLTAQKDIYLQLKDALARKLGPSKVKDESQGERYILRVMLGEDQIKDVPLFLPKEELAKVKEAGFKLIPRFGNYSRVDKQGVNASFAQLEGYSNLSTVIFQGEEALGYQLPDNYLETTRENLAQGNLTVGLVEFVEQKGVATLARGLDYQAIRVHSIPPREMEKMTIDTALARWTRAVTERNVRVVYLRPFLSGEALAGKDPLAVNVQYIKDVAQNLQQAGFQLGQAKPFRDYQVGNIAAILLSLGTLAAGIMLWKSYFPKPVISEYLLFVLALGAVIGLFLTGHGYQARKVLALAAAVIFPTLGVIKLLEDWRRRKNVGPLLSLLKAGVYSLIGGLLIASLLADTSFFLKINSFSGVKLLHVIPLVLITLYYFFFVERKKGKRIWERINDFLDQPILVKYVFAMFILMGMAFIYLTRTGNTGAVPVFNLEIQARQFLEDLLVARPRTKEFLLGHPALLLGSALVQGKNYDYLFPVVLLGSIGQISIVSTFTHLHTPLFISLLRSFNGIILGAVLGWFLVALYRFWRKRGEKNA